MTEIKIIHKYLKAQHLHAELDITQKGYPVYSWSV